MSDDPNAQRKAHLRAEIDRAIGHLDADAQALAEAKATLERDTARLDRLQGELKGILALEAREDAHEAEQAAR